VWCVCGVCACGVRLCMILVYAFDALVCVVYVGAEGISKVDSAEKGPAPILKSPLYTKKEEKKRTRARHQLSVLKSQLYSGFVLQIYQVTSLSRFCNRPSMRTTRKCPHVPRDTGGWGVGRGGGGGCMGQGMRHRGVFASPFLRLLILGLSLSLSL
jgi:hypothetical protein